MLISRLHFDFLLMTVSGRHDSVVIFGAQQTYWCAPNDLARTKKLIRAHKVIWCSPIKYNAICTLWTLYKLESCLNRDDYLVPN